ncbi:MAG TPA: PEGA domain-containing protein [Anaeromyxobacter sp.]|nr:PEGA domain-containing protein [Anaeromyxobacter sp.]
MTSPTAALVAAATLALAPALAPGAGPAAAPAKLRLAVLDFSLAGSAHPDLARVLSDAAARGAEGSDYQIITQGEVAAVLGLDRLRQLLGCSDEESCLSDTARALDAERLLSGSLTILERTALVTVRLIDAHKGRTLSRASTSLLDATEKELVDAARRLSYEVITGKRLDTSGLLRLQVDRPGAAVTLDGKEIGKSPLSEVPRVLEGPHTVVIQKDGYVRWSTTVSVPPGGEVPVEAQLIPVKLLGEAARSRLWSWAYASTGVTVVAVGGGLVFHKLADDSYARYKRATNRTDAQNLRDQTRQRATLANVSFGLAGAAAVGAGTLFILAARADARAAEGPPLAVLFTGQGLVLAGRF